MINKNHKLFPIINDFCIRSTNMYNFAQYHVRNKFIKEGIWLKFQEMQILFKKEDCYKKLMSQSSQYVLQVLEKDWRSYFEGLKSYKKDASKFLEKPKFPKYKKKGKPSNWYIKNNTSYIKDGRLYFRLRATLGYSFKTKVTGRLIAVRFKPKNDVFIMEIIYEKEVSKDIEENNNIASIDCGVNNFITLSDNIGNNPILIKGGILKSINQNYNKKRAYYHSILPKEVKWSKRLKTLDRKRFQRIKNYIHNCSRFIINYCLKYNIKTLILGNNDRWKQKVNLGDKNNQNFVCIPYEMLIEQLEYKCLDNNIKFIVTEESFTSGTSFLDNEEPIRKNYNIKRRICRGLFKSNEGKIINSDVNASLQIMKKVIPKAVDNGIEVCLIPITIKNVINYIKM